MEHKPLVSITIIFLNAEQFIAEAIDSVLAQTYGRWELLLVDDGSSDGSTAIARRYASQRPEQIRYLEHPGHRNHGMSAARNLGIGASSGAYIAFLDADDVLLPEALAEQVAILEAHPEAAMVYGPIEWWYSWTGDPADRQRDFIQDLRVEPNTIVEPPALVPIFVRKEGATPCAPLLRREIVERVGGFEAAFKGMYEDQVFRAKICLQAPVFVSGKTWYRYRQQPAGCCSVTVRAGQYHRARRTYLGWLAAYAGAQGVRDAAVWDALRHELWPYQHPVLHTLAATARGLTPSLAALLVQIARLALPLALRRSLGDVWALRKRQPPVGRVRLGSLRRRTPISRAWGYDRGLPVDRYYIERFLAAHAPDIRGRVLEIGDDTYTRRFGGQRVSRSDVLHVSESGPPVTIVADLCDAEQIPSDSFDCIIITQTLPFIYDVAAAIATLERILKPGGVVLATVSGISKVSRHDMDHWGHFWHFTSLSARRRFEEAFSSGQVHVATYGNVLASIAFLHGMAAAELSQADLDYHDPDYELAIGIRAVKREAAL
jgi:glycosyltransferase involved in cell wall biosynthesis/SAM-dependent methyltransferase